MQNKKKFITREKLDRIASRARTIGYLLSMAAFGLVVSSLGPILPDLAAQMSVPINTMSWVFTARAGGALVGSFLSGRIFDRVKGHLILVVCFVSQALVLAFLPFFEDIWLLIAVLFFSGIAHGFIIVGVSTFIVWEHVDNPAPMVSTQGFFTGVGNFLSPLIISWVVSSRGEYARAFWIYAMIYTLLAVLFLYTPSPEIRASKDEVSNVRGQAKLSGILFLIALIFLLYTGSEVTYNSWIFSIATSAYPLLDASARLLNSLFWGALTTGRVFVGILSRRFTPSQILRVSFIGAVVSFTLAFFLQGSTLVLWTATISAGLFMAVIFPTMMLFVEKKMQLSSKMSGTFFMATSVGGMLLPWVAGQLFTYANPHWVKAEVAICLAAAFLIFQRVNTQIANPTS